MKNVGFFVRHFLERGTEIASYDYAHYNETILKNKSYIICFTPEKQKEMGWPTDRITFSKFQERFNILEINSISNMQCIIETYKLDFFHTLVYGTEAPEYEFSNREIWQNCKTIKHCVFDTTYPEGDFYCCISNFLNARFNTSLPVLPHIVSLPESNESLRSLLNIPESAIVFGGYGAKRSFSIKYVHDIVYKVASQNKNIYFLFANFEPFCPPLPNILHLPTILDLLEKVKFINTCDAMLWARADGETFGLSIGEFSSKNKPILCSPVGDLAHLHILKEKAVVYTNPMELEQLLLSFNKDSISQYNWRGYTEYTPEMVMKQFESIFNFLSS